MTNEETMKQLCKIIQKLHDQSSYYWKNRTNIHGEKVDGDLYDFYEDMIRNRGYWLIDDCDLKNRLRESVKPDNLELHINGITEKGQSKGRFYLPPLMEEPEFVAMLSLECNMRSGKTSVRIEMFRSFKGRPYGIGYRFEHGGHEFCHASLTNKRPDHEGGKHLDNCPEWLPTDIPRVPMRADNPVSLLMDVLISLFGTKGYSILAS
jgi:hypothetical protein